MHDEKGNAILALTGKGEKSRRVKITMDATQLLDKYITYRRIRDQPDRYVFPSQRNTCLSVPAIEEILQNTSQWQRQRTRTSFAVARIRHM